MAYMRLGELLIAAGTINQEELDKGLALQQQQKGRLGDVLIANGIITEKELIEALQAQLGIEFVDLTKINIPTELAQVVPKHVARKHGVVPVRTYKDELHLAMSDPLNFFAIEEVRKLVRRKVVPVLATKEAIERSMQILYGNEGAARAIEDMRREAGGTGEVTPEADTAFTATKLEDGDSSSAPTIRLVNSIIDRAVTERASDIHLEPHESELLVRMRVDGLLRRTLTVPRDLQNSVIARIKIMSGLDIAEKRIPQDGRFNVTVGDKNIDIRVSTLPTVYGEKVVARLLDKTGGRVSLEKIGLTDEGLAALKALLRYRNGVILVVGPTGSGKTTTMYSMIHEINRDDVNLVTLEDPVEYNIEGVNQVQIHEKVGLTFASGLRSILRQDPDIIAVGEIRDGETADIAMRAAITGHVVLSTIHTNDAVGTIERLEDMGVEPYLVASAMRGMVSQRLLRKICPKCREAYEATQTELLELGIPEEQGLTLYRGTGCPSCFNTGYAGRTAIVEVMTLNSTLRRMIADKAPRAAIEDELHKPGSGFISLRESALNLAREGITTSEEILRVVNDDN